MANDRPFEGPVPVNDDDRSSCDDETNSESSGTQVRDTDEAWSDAGEDFQAQITEVEESLGEAQNQQAQADSNETCNTVPEHSYERGCFIWAPAATTMRHWPCARYAVITSEGDIFYKYLTVVENLQQNINCRKQGFFQSREFIEMGPLYLMPGDWNTAKLYLFRRKNRLAYKVFRPVLKVLPGLNDQALWPEKPSFDLNDLEPWLDYPDGLDKHSALFPCVHEPAFGGKPMIAKLWLTPACIPRGIETEMMAYRAAAGTGLTPEFIGHVTERGRVVGFLMECVQGARKPVWRRDRESCREAVKRFYEATGWLRADKGNRRHNFLIKDGNALLIDLSTALSPANVQRRPQGWVEEMLGEDLGGCWSL
ncbi:hypothetical protein M406DRAFT_66163 [Cryphonectria parasitica EP155]|uniref:Aminoglycoside phosphotransferase domain-containing protein n=1 Tax=Cryphonectria parasitica (strain ATCC 38755 / EP155) TaxID=660469 RepID=A0A9P4YAY4_CRYP1|nr:uncharacterized protein M406DRAFT_66163 [Cryphonectria parasitica EP155]KAF3769691.1 hypothetical protein M406DRAFT_66163 [Cryphonectria parasitica EP155]